MNTEQHKKTELVHCLLLIRHLKGIHCVSCNDTMKVFDVISDTCRYTADATISSR